jgi:hypothetical protein
MAEPFSIIAGVVGLLASITTLSVRIGEFSANINDAKKDMQSVTRELESLALILPKLQNEFKISPTSLSSQLRTDLGNVLQACNRTVVELEILLKKCSTRSLKSFQWAFSGRRECGSLRGSLEAYKSTIHLTLTLMTM